MDTITVSSETSKDDAIPLTTFHARNFLTEECTSCKSQMVLDDGDVTYDGKWYHATCWGRPE
jgi:hypothetical protein